jgi:hypothetical protein
MAQQNPNTLTLDEMYQIATDTQRESGGKSKKTIASDEDEEIAAFQKQKFSKFSDRKKKTNTPQAANRSVPSRTRPGNNANWKRKYCFYCKLQKNTQEDCFKRIC